MIPAASAISGSSSISISTKCTLWSYSSITCHEKFWKKIKTLLLCNLIVTIPSNKEVKVISFSYYVMHNITINVFSYISIKIHDNTFTTVYVLNFKSWSWRMHREDDYSLEWSLTVTIYPQHQTELESLPRPCHLGESSSWLLVERISVLWRSIALGRNTRSSIISFSSGFRLCNEYQTSNRNWFGSEVSPEDIEIVHSKEVHSNSNNIMKHWQMNLNILFLKFYVLMFVLFQLCHFF